MEEIDENIKPLTQLHEVFNPQLIDFLQEEYQDIYKRCDSKGSLRLILVYHEDLFAYLEISGDEGNIKLYSVRKNEEKHVFDEEQLISDVITKILHWLWISLASDY